MNECAICLRKTRHNRMTPPCGHAFHSRCLATWTSRADKNTCPMCRASGMKQAVKRNLADNLTRLRSAIDAFVRASNQQRVRRRFPSRMFPDHPELQRVVKTILVLMYFSAKNEALQTAYLNVVKESVSVDRKIFRAGISPASVYRAFYSVMNARESARARAVLASVDFFTENGVLLRIRPSADKTLVTPDFAFMKKLLKALAVDDLDGRVKALTKARKEWRKDLPPARLTS